MKNEQRKQLRNERGQLVTLVNEWDPAGLLRAGASRDEYDPIVDKLLALLSRNASEADVAGFLEREIREHFGTAAPQASRFAAKVMVWSRLISHEST